MGLDNRRYTRPPFLTQTRATIQDGYLKVVNCTTGTNGKKVTSMKRTIIYVGLDVDDTHYHGAALDKDSGEIIDFKWRPTLKGLLGQLDTISRYFIYRD